MNIAFELFSTENKIRENNQNQLRPTNKKKTIRFSIESQQKRLKDGARYSNQLNFTKSYFVYLLY